MHANQRNCTTEPRTKMLFVWDNEGEECVAVMPELPGTTDLATCTCYSRIGQHSHCVKDWMHEATRPAYPEEYSSLAVELTSLGYSIELAGHWSQAMDHKRYELLVGKD